MKIKITSTYRPHLWYADKMGEIFEVTYEDNVQYGVTIDGDDWYVRKSDAEIVEEQT